MKNKLKLSIQEHAYNEDLMLRQIMANARSQGIKPIVRQTYRMPRLLKLGLTMLLVAVFVLLGITQLSDFDPFHINNTAITAIYALDINPSFEVSVNKQDKVVLVTPTNDDAKTITVTDLIGQDSAIVIETLIKRAELAGFIDTTDLVDDYVLVTSVPVNTEDLNQADTIETKLNDQAKTSTFLQELNIAVVKSDLVTLRKAENKKVPIGLYVINGFVKQPDNTYLSAKDFFSNPTYRATFKTKGAIKEDKENILKARILIALGKLDAIGVDTAALKTRLITAQNGDLIKLQIEVRKLLNKHHLGSSADASADNTTA